MDARISVAICTYNGARFLKKQLDSIAGQTHLPYEVVLCDDGSTDLTGEIIVEWASRVSFPVCIIRNTVKLGSTKNFEQAIQQCNGDVIVLSDQDDEWHPSKLEVIDHTLEGNSKIGYVFSDGDVISSDGSQIGVSMWESLGFNSNSLIRSLERDELRVLLKQNPVTGAAMAFRATLRSIILPIPSCWVHDHWIALIGSTFMGGRGIAERLISYRQHEEQQKGVRTAPLGERCRTSLATESSECVKKLNQMKLFESRVLAHAGAGVDPNKAIRILEKIHHLSARASARSSRRMYRTTTVLTEALSCRYHHYSKGWASIVRDLIL